MFPPSLRRDSVIVTPIEDFRYIACRLRFVHLPLVSGVSSQTFDTGMRHNGGSERLCMRSCVQEARLPAGG